MFGRTVVKYADDLVAAHAARDGDRFAKAGQGLARTAAKAGPEQLAQAVNRLAPLLAEIKTGVGGNLAGLVGGLVGLDGDFRPVLPVLTDRAIAVLGDALRFPDVLGAEPPDPEDESAIGPVLEGLAPENRPLAEAWFTADDWVQPVLFLNQRKDVRAAQPRRDELTAAVAAAEEVIGAAQWLHGLLQVLDDETLLVVDRASGRAFRVVISGLGDNFQLHTLLAAGLPPEILPGAAPSPVEIAAATTGNPQPPGGISGNVNLVDAFGAWIWNEGRPADIPHLDGVRVVVIDPPPYARSWNTGRGYPLMVPSLQVTGELPPAEAAELAAKIKPSGR
ncbi:hypothetical protein [Actinoplanes sp. HUAS TT8]|uniref:hypothetical protein n=1 Tax=Actinoplanes sp. HUAS TT8 TaxID=3447453 RepID=UPI003F52437A